jgi:hypothetical protein
MSNFFYSLAIAIFLITYSAHTYAQEVYEFYNGARAMAMGGATIAVVNDETALLNNPAGLGKLREMYGTILDPELELGQTYLSLNGNKIVSSPFDLESVRSSLSTATNKYYHIKAQLFPSFVVRNFGFGFYGRQSLNAMMDSTGTSMATYYRDDFAFVAGINLRLFDGRIKIGVNGRAVNRIEVNKTLTSTDTYSLAAQATEGSAIATDVGLIMSAPWYLIPTVSAVVRDVGNTKFTFKDGVRARYADRPGQVDQDTDVAVALFPIHTNRSRSVFTAEVQKLSKMSQDADKSKYYHVGYEYNFGDVLFIRAGMNQRYYTGGLELSTKHTQFQFSSYGEEIGTASAPVEDRRYILKFTIRF